MAISSSGRQLATVVGNGRIQVWNVDTGALERVLGKSNIGVSSLAFHPSRPELACACRAGTVRTWNTETGEELAPIRAHEQPAGALAFDSDGRRIATSSSDGEVKLWDYDGRSFIRRLDGELSVVHRLKFSSDGTVLAAARAGGVAKLWDVETGPARLGLALWRDAPRSRRRVGLVPGRRVQPRRLTDSRGVDRQEHPNLGRTRREGRCGEESEVERECDSIDSARIRDDARRVTSGIRGWRMYRRASGAFFDPAFTEYRNGELR